MPPNLRLQKGSRNKYIQENDDLLFPPFFSLSTGPEPSNTILQHNSFQAEKLGVFSSNRPEQPWMEDIRTSETDAANRILELCFVYTKQFFERAESVHKIKRNSAH